ncbi:hypothetical protein [Haliangium sp.]|uniref:hypothetical protein n=1 Tax=Haliangium sp. TaxID=2663208 RepID=UPI003D0C295B
MIDLRGRRPAKPPAFDQSPQIRAARAHLSALVEAGRTPRGRDFPDLWTEHKNLFAAAQGEGKCAYCESRIRSSDYGEIDHYRPKAAVARYDRRGQRDDVGGGGGPGRRIRHRERPGYWWLAYEWTNWLYTCRRCNSWKGDQFRVVGRARRRRPGVEALERATVLNPYEVDPAPHLCFDESGGIRGATRAGRDTIDLCGLDRRSLVHERERVARALRRLVDDYLLAGAPRSALAQRFIDQMRSYCRDDAPYAGMCRYLLRRWESPGTRSKP